ncbi:MAG: hypothetical protein GXO66_01130 [Euryarchaeota archaeon]|nr:hypothetical protein [Euryarchaeota archaeon]
MDRRIILISVAFLLLLSGCTSEEKSYVSTPPGEVQDFTFQPEVFELTIGELLANASQLSNQYVTTRGTVQETVSTQSYTYARISDGTGEVWVAGPKTELSEGEEVVVSAALVLLGFQSPTLNKTLDVILMVQSFSSGEPYSFHGTTSAPEPANISVERLPGGYTVAEVLERSDELAGSEVSLRAVVVKVLPDILNKTWIHLQDGSVTGKGERELVVTYTGGTQFEVGDRVVVRGVVETNVDIGAGYFFRVLIDDASIEKEM